MNFYSDADFLQFDAELQIIEHEMKERGEYFDWDVEAEKYYPEYDRARQRWMAEGFGPDGSMPLEEYEARKQEKELEKRYHTEVLHLSDFNNCDLPELPFELIRGILRKRRKMLLAGPSKAGKTGLLMELALALVNGGNWLGFPCIPCRVLYFDFENDFRTSVNRFFLIAERLYGTRKIPTGLDLMNWRGKTMPLDELKADIIQQAKDRYDVIILDPMYKIITGDENNATDMSYFCRQLDDIIEQTGATVIYCHHHSKGAQGQKKAMDRASGSGVFARDADALLDIIELGVTEKYRATHETPEGASAWRMEFTLREFAHHKEVCFWYDYPVHVVDENLSGLYVLGSREANLAASRKRADPEEKKKHARQVIEGAFDALDTEGTGMVELSKAAAHAAVSTKSIQRYVKLFPAEYANPVGSGMLVKLGTDAAKKFGL